MKKYLIYTVSDFKSRALDCIDILYDSLLIKNSKDNFDFAIVTTDQSLPESCQHQLFIHKNLNLNYIGWLKYTDMLPAGYEQYIYLDSDIIFLDKIENILQKDSVTLVSENYSMSHEWFCYSNASQEEKNKMNAYSGYNAGTFAFNNINFIQDINNITKSINYNDLSCLNQAKMEQSIFNYSLFLKMQNNNLSVNNITNMVSFSPEKCFDKTIYHFAGFSGEMANKYDRMNIFYKNRKVICD
jgi:hypothetical protein